MITTPEQLAARIGVPKETLAIAVQTIGVIPYLRSVVDTYGTMNVIGLHNGKIERAGQAFERVTGEKMEKRKGRGK